MTLTNNQRKAMFAKHNHSSKLHEYGVGQNISGMIGTIKAKNRKEALQKSIRLPMYDFRQKTKIWKHTYNMPTLKQYEFKIFGAKDNRIKSYFVKAKREAENKTGGFTIL